MKDNGDELYSDSNQTNEIDQSARHKNEHTSIFPRSFVILIYTSLSVVYAFHFSGYKISLFIFRLRDNFLANLTVVK